MYNFLTPDVLYRQGIPSSRMVLLKAFSSEGFKIFTNLDSRKGMELRDNPHAALLFYWDFFNKQVRIEGRVKLLPRREVQEYFESRPKKSQLSASVSDQSRVIDSRNALIARYQKLEEEHSNDPFLPLPSSWGGFLLIPHRFEFWVGQSSRLHDRIVFRRPSSSAEGRDGHEDDNDRCAKPGEDGWIMERLQP